MPYRFRILVVDDEPAQRELVSGFLKKQGFDVAAAESGVKALAAFSSGVHRSDPHGSKDAQHVGFGSAAGRARHQP